MKSRDFQKAHLGSLLNVHTLCQIPSSIWREIMRGTISKHEKKRPKNHMWLCRGEMRDENEDPEKALLRLLPNLHTKFQHSWLNLEGK